MRAIPLWFVSLLCIVLAGCGGSTGQSTPTGPITGTTGGSTVQVGQFSLKTDNAANLKPVTASGGGTVVTGLAGANITALELATKPDLSSTRIMFDISNVVYSVRPDGSEVKMIGQNIPYDGGGSLARMNASGKILFQGAQPSGVISLYTMNPDGTGVQLVRTPAATKADAFGEWSPDGTKIVFDEASSDQKHNIIYTMNANGTGLTQRTDGLHVDAYPCWSPDGVTIAFVRLDTSFANGQVYTNASGMTSVPLTSNIAGGGSSFPSWSPDGKKIAVQFSKASPPSNSIALLSTVNSQNEVVTAGLTEFDNFPTWSPDGRFLSFLRSDPSATTFSIMTANADGTSANPIATFSKAGAPTWSPFPVRIYLGGVGLLGTSAAAFLYSQSSDGIDSVLSFSATTPSTATAIQDPNVNPDSGTTVLRLKADHITSLRFVNGLYEMPVTAVPAPGFPAASGVLASYYTGSGKLESILPYIASKVRPSEPGGLMHKGTVTYHGAFLGVLDSHGKNHAPAGASSVTIDLKSGKVVSFR